YSNQNNF
nr:Chain A, Major prion protein [Homo sapiens]7RVJ_B Chain B, Major prion protein [Homo sapiens]